MDGDPQPKTPPGSPAAAPEAAVGPGPEPPAEGQPALTKCLACGADVSRVCLSGILTLPVVEQGPMTLHRGNLMSTGTRVRMVPQLVTLTPQRCPECGHPFYFVAEGKVTVAGPGALGAPS